MKSDVPEKLVREYRATEYRVGKGIEEFVLRVDVRSDALAEVLTDTGQTCAIFITGYNPFSQPRSLEENQVANSLLAEDLYRLTDHVVVGIGIHPSGIWTGEPGYLALGVELDASRVLGEKFRQNAIIWAGENAVPRLILLR
jgi:hypothetical protein